MFRSRFAAGVAVALATFVPSAFAQRTFNGRIDAGTNVGGFRPGVYGNVYQGNQIDFRNGNYSGQGAYGYGYFGGYQPNPIPPTIQVDLSQYQRRLAETAQQAVPPTFGYAPTITPHSGSVPVGTGPSPATGPTSAIAGSIPSPPTMSTARITVRLPADAELWFETVKTLKTGTERVFTTPAVRSGGHYGYWVTARWLQDGRTVTRERMVRFEAGGDVVVNLDEPNAAPPPSLASPRH